MRLFTLIAQVPLDIVDAQRGRLFLWLPVCFGIGIGVFFAQPLEPSVTLLGVILAGVILGLLALIKTPPRVAPLLIAMLTVSMGFFAAGLRSHMVSEPVLTFRYYGPVEGRVVHIDRSASDALRLTLDQVTLRNFAPDRTPHKVRISLYGDQSFVAPEPGMRLALTAHLSPPSGPSEPGAFEFQRMAWFDKLGAVGYTRVPALRIADTDRSLTLWVHRLRQTLSFTLQSQIPGQPGAFAAAILTGDRSGITLDTAEALRGANLSHLLAISGLHMGLLTGSVFFALRLCLAMIPGAALTWPLKKIAASGALAAGLFYLALSGFNVATERAFVMVAVMLVAVLLDRQAISLRAVAIAALLILVLRPEVLPEPGFQMSFAATTALVAVFSIVRRLRLMSGWPNWLRGVATVVLSSAVAGIATAPVAAAHFNRIADFGLLANVISVPMMGAVIMPAAILALLLTPLGLQGLALAIMGGGIRWILAVAHMVSGWDGAVSHLAAPPPETLPLIAIGGIFVILWRGRGQLLGILPVLAGFVLWSMADRPALLISDDGSLVGRMGAEGRVLNKAKGAGFVASVWLENDGDFADQITAAARDMPVLDLSGLRIAHVSGRGWQEATRTACASHDFVVVNQLWEEAVPEGCLLIDVGFLRQSGALALAPRGDTVEMRTAYATSGVRLWNTPALRGPRAGEAREARDALPPMVLGTRFTPDAVRLANRH
ncbi:competence protein ComEC [Celeribacter baekdonensis]|uniref:Competence protein ComEC n=1 Tax=Celeribacter baekdonensis TaxID=875171 RepID=A0A1G7GC77_9RHOB|nr:ComEC/Rec2 family competence protein [Celeribacter baekdonensis]SDE85711.1 competence protein ComEC [Celeribacter baekdonensis]